MAGQAGLLPRRHEGTKNIRHGLHGLHGSGKPISPPAALETQRTRRKTLLKTGSGSQSIKTKPALFCRFHFPRHVLPHSATFDGCFEPRNKNLQRDVPDFRDIKPKTLSPTAAYASRLRRAREPARRRSESYGESSRVKWREWLFWTKKKGFLSTDLENNQV